MAYTPCSGDETDCGCGCTESHPLKALTLGRLGALATDHPYDGSVGVAVTSAVALAAAAIAVADYLGIDLGGMLYDGADWVVELFGFDLDACSSDNKNKYKNMVRHATAEDLLKWLKKGRVHFAVGNCNKFALALAAARAKKLSEDMQAAEGAQAAERAAREAAEAEAAKHARLRQQMQQSFSDRTACVRKMQDLGIKPGHPLYREMRDRCKEFEDTHEECTPPEDALLAGMGHEGWCHLGHSERAEILAGIQAVLTDERRMILQTTPRAERRKAFLAMVAEDNGTATAGGPAGGAPSPAGPMQSGSGPIQPTDSGSTSTMLYVGGGLLLAGLVGYFVFMRDKPAKRAA